MVMVSPMAGKGIMHRMITPKPGKDISDRTTIPERQVEGAHLLGVFYGVLICALALRAVYRLSNYSP